MEEKHDTRNTAKVGYIHGWPNHVTWAILWQWIILGNEWISYSYITKTGKSQNTTSLKADQIIKYLMHRAHLSRLPRIHSGLLSLGGFKKHDHLSDSIDIRKFKRVEAL